MLNISKYGQDVLFDQSQNKKLETGEYLTDTNNENYKYIKDKFFLYEDDTKVQLLNIGSGLFTTIADVFAFYVWNPSIDLDVPMDDFVRDMVSVWFCTIWLERVDWKLKMVYQPAKNYWNENWIDKISRLYIDDNEIYYILVQSYYAWYIENKLYKLRWTDINSWDEVPLDTIPQTTGLLDIVQTWLDVPALIVVWDNPISILAKVKPLVYAIDRQIVMNHTQYLQNVESFVIFKGIKRPQKLLDEYNKWHRINFSQIGRIINWDENSTVEFVNNVNSLIDTAIKDMDNYTRRICAMTTIPVEFMWLESNEWAIWLWSRTLRHWAFMKKVKYYRDLLDEAITKFLKLAKIDEPYTRWDIFVKTDKELADELKVAREIKIISQFNAIKKYNNYTEEEAIEEQQLIEEEDANATPAIPVDEWKQTDTSKKDNFNNQQPWWQTQA